MAAQGVLHSGMKYVLAGKVTEDAEVLASAAKHWKDAIHGRSTYGPNLRGVRLLSNFQYLLSMNKTPVNMRAIEGSPLLRDRIFEWESMPEELQQTGYKGSVHEINEPVVDVEDLMDRLETAAEGQMICGELTEENLEYVKGDVQDAWIANVGGFRLRAKAFVSLAGRGNQKLVGKYFGGETLQQERPLKQVLVVGEGLPDLFMVANDGQKKPPFVLTTHRTAAGTPVWYVGGRVAEAGATMGAEEHFAHAKEVLGTWFPQVNLDACHFSQLAAVRAEGISNDGDRPEGTRVNVSAQNKLIVGWPNKLVLSPLLAEQVARELMGMGIEELRPRTNVLPAQDVKRLKPAWHDLDALDGMKM